MSHLFVLEEKRRKGKGLRVLRVKGYFFSIVLFVMETCRGKIIVGPTP